MRWSVFWVQKAPNLKQLTHAHTPPKPTTTTTTTTRTTTTATTTKAKTTTRFASSEGLRLARISQFARVAGSARRFPNILEVSALSAIKTSQNTPNNKNTQMLEQVCQLQQFGRLPAWTLSPWGALERHRTPSNAHERPRTPSNGPSRALECPRTTLEPHFGQILKIWKLCWFCETKTCLHVFGHKLSRCRQNVWTLVGFVPKSFIYTLLWALRAARISQRPFGLVWLQNAGNLKV